MVKTRKTKKVSVKKALLSGMIAGGQLQFLL